MNPSGLPNDSAEVATATMSQRGGAHKPFSGKLNIIFRLSLAFVQRGGIIQERITDADKTDMRAPEDDV